MSLWQARSRTVISPAQHGGTCAIPLTQSSACPQAPCLIQTAALNPLSSAVQKWLFSTKLGGMGYDTTGVANPAALAASASHSRNSTHHRLVVSILGFQGNLWNSSALAGLGAAVQITSCSWQPTSGLTECTLGPGVDLFGTWGSAVSPSFSLRLGTVRCAAGSATGTETALLCGRCQLSGSIDVLATSATNALFVAGAAVQVQDFSGTAQLKSTLWTGTMATSVSCAVSGCPLPYQTCQAGGPRSGQCSCD